MTKLQGASRATCESESPMSNTGDGTEWENYENCSQSRYAHNFGALCLIKVNSVLSVTRMVEQ